MKPLSLLAVIPLAACASQSPVTSETDKVLIVAAQEFFTHAVNAYSEERYGLLNCPQLTKEGSPTGVNKPEECGDGDDRYYPPETRKFIDDESAKAREAERMALTALELDENADHFDCMEVSWGFFLSSNDPFPERSTTLWEKDQRHYIETYDPIIGSGPSWVTVRSTDSNWDARRPSCK